MSIMTIRAMKLTEDIHSIKVAYEKNGKLFIRTGKDGFSTGDPSPTSLKGLGKWGFRKVEGNARFRTADEILDNLTKFELDRSGTIKYQG